MTSGARLVGKVRNIWQTHRKHFEPLRKGASDWLRGVKKPNLSQWARTGLKHVKRNISGAILGGIVGGVVGAATARKETRSGGSATWSQPS